MASIILSPTLQTDDLEVFRVSPRGPSHRISRSRSQNTYFLHFLSFGNPITVLERIKDEQHAFRAVASQIHESTD